jgi:DNA invertase Pin-like site-specific DNA recombinase
MDLSAECGTELTAEDNDPTKKLIRQVLGAISEWEKTSVVLKLRAARVRMRRAGQRCEGRKAYGATPEEQAVVEKMNAWRKEKKSYAEIAAALNTENVPPQSGVESKWHTTQVQRVLKRLKG